MIIRQRATGASERTRRPGQAPWEVADLEPPDPEDVEAIFRYAVRYALLAPSGHNTQPWLFHVAEDALELYADRTRRLPVVDPHDRALVLSCGAALFHARIALRHLGFRPRTEARSDREDPDLLAVMRLGSRSPPAPEEEALFHAIPERRTNRLPFDGRPVPEELLSGLVRCAEKEGVDLRLIRAVEEKEAVAELITEGDRIQGGDPAFRRELAAWIRPNRTASCDGMPGRAFGIGALKSYAGPLVIRTFDWGNGQAARDRELALGSPALGVLATEGDSSEAWLRGGQALGRVLLRATAGGVSASFLNQPIEVGALRPRLRATLGLEAVPQLLLRLGYGPRIDPTPRRSLDEVILRGRPARPGDAPGRPLGGRS